MARAACAAGVCSSTRVAVGSCARVWPVDMQQIGLELLDHVRQAELQLADQSGPQEDTCLSGEGGWGNQPVCGAQRREEDKKD